MKPALERTSTDDKHYTIISVMYQGLYKVHASDHECVTNTPDIETLVSTSMIFFFREELVEDINFEKLKNLARSQPDT